MANHKSAKTRIKRNNKRVNSPIANLTNISSNLYQIVIYIIADKNEISFLLVTSFTKLYIKIPESGIVRIAYIFKPKLKELTIIANKYGIYATSCGYKEHMLYPKSLQ